MARTSTSVTQAAGLSNCSVGKSTSAAVSASLSVSPKLGMKTVPALAKAGRYGGPSEAVSLVRIRYLGVRAGRFRRGGARGFITPMASVQRADKTRARGAKPEAAQDVVFAWAMPNEPQQQWRST
jgi:hypothetical protein